MLIRLDERSDKPIYLQIADSIGGQIDSGVLAAGERLPAARALAQTVEVNMHTVLKAYSTLESKGLVEMRRGRGGVVVAAAADVKRAARDLVSAAKRSRMDRGELADLIEEVW